MSEVVFPNKITKTKNYRDFVSFKNSSFFGKKFQLLKKIDRYFLYKFNTYLNINYVQKIKLWFGGDIFVNSNDPEIFSLLFFRMLPLDEVALTNYLIKNLAEEDIFYDVGANYGYYTSLAGKIITKGEVHSFEPNPKVYSCLKKLKRDNFFLNNLAISDTQEDTSLYISDRGSGKGSLNKLKPGNKQMQIKTTTLDNYLKNRKIPNIIKIDVEGSEEKLIAGGLDTLKKFNGSLIIELWGGEKGEKYSSKTLSILGELNFRPHKILNDGSFRKLNGDLSDITSPHENILFLK